eukprot:symbB.v1.2.011330.t3/scaffold759.1/size164804/4
MVNFYDVLLVHQTATLEEIKLAFKRRALEVHPDKGGSKEAFHLVYQALETLTNPEARSSHDHHLSGQRQGSGGSAGSKARAKSTVPRKDTRKCGRKETGFEGRYDGGHTSESPMDGKQRRLIVKMYGLLKQLPREDRNDIIRRDFTQPQRLLLEKWIVKTSAGETADSNLQFHLENHNAPDESEHALALVPVKSVKIPKESSKIPTRSKRTPQTNQRRACGCIRKNRSTGHGGSYVAVIRFDAIHIEMWTAKCDLPTALEYLLILTSVKQKMMDVRRSSTDVFEDRLQCAFLSSANEHGKNHSDLSVRFCLVYSMRSLIGSTEFRSPTVRKIHELSLSRRYLDPFRCLHGNIGRGNIFWSYDPLHLLETWKRFQNAVIQTWTAVGLDSTKIIQKIQALYQANDGARQRHLRIWENQHMAMQDKRRYQPAHVRQIGCWSGATKRKPRTVKIMALVKKLLIRWRLWLDKATQKCQAQRKKARAFAVLAPAGASDKALPVESAHRAIFSLGMRPLPTSTKGDRRPVFPALQKFGEELDSKFDGNSKATSSVGKAEALEMIKGLSLGRRHRRAEVGWHSRLGSESLVTPPRAVSTRRRKSLEASGPTPQQKRPSSRQRRTNRGKEPEERPEKKSRRGTGDPEIRRVLRAALDEEMDATVSPALDKVREMMQRRQEDAGPLQDLVSQVQGLADVRRFVDEQFAVDLGGRIRSCHNLVKARASGSTMSQPPPAPKPPVSRGRPVPEPAPVATVAPTRSLALEPFRTARRSTSRC